MRPIRRVAWLIGLALLYLWFVVTATRDEAIAALVVALAVSLMLGRIERITQCFATAPLAGWLALVRRVPYAIVRESLDLLGPVLWRALVRRERVRGRWIALRYEPDGTEPSDGFGRRTLVVFGSNLTPNAIPLGIDNERARIVLHQIVFRRESAADDPRFPI